MFTSYHTHVRENPAQAVFILGRLFHTTKNTGTLFVENTIMLKQFGSCQ